MRMDNDLILHCALAQRHMRGLLDYLVYQVPFGVHNDFECKYALMKAAGVVPEHFVMELFRRRRYLRQLKRELARVTEEPDILKKPPRISPRMQSEIRICCRAS